MDGVIGLDAVKMREKIAELKTLRVDLHSHYGAIMLSFGDVSASSTGDAATKMTELDSQYRQEGAMLDLLIGNTITYLQGVLDSFEAADKTVADGIVGGGVSNGTGKS